MSASFWAGRRVLVTGHSGFKGSWLTLWLNSLGADVTGLALPAPAEEPSLWNMLRSGLPVRELTGDIRDRPVVEEAFALARPEVVFHLAAQALVSRGYRDPVETFAVNVDGTANVLDAVRACPAVKAVVVVTSDKVYDSASGAQPYTEAAPLGGSDPYSASKVAAEVVTTAYRRSYLAPRGTAVATARAGNVIGGGDWSPDRLVPDVMRTLRFGTPLLVRYPDATRPWQHVLDPLRGYLLLAEELSERAEQAPPALNFGPSLSSCVSVSELLDRLGTHCGTMPSWDRDTVARAAEAPSLVLSSQLATEVLGWRPLLDLEQALAWTAEWYQADRKGGDVVDVTRSQIDRFERLAQS